MNYILSSAIRIVAVCMLFTAFHTPSVLCASTPDALDTTRGWRTGGVFGINITNIGLSNWAGGGQNTFAIAGLVNAFASYKSENLMNSWDNALDAGYGFARVGKDPLRKSDDRIVIISKYTRQLVKESPFGVSALLDFRTQLADGYDYANATPAGDALLISRAFAPAYVSISTGIDYKPSENLALFLSPVGGRVIIVGDTQLSNRAAFGVDSGRTAKLDLGTTFNVFYKMQVMENITFQTRLGLFSAYTSLSTVVVNWETLTLMNVNKYIKVSFNTQLIYDDKVMINRDNGTVGPSTQFKNTLAIGFSLPF